MIILTFSIKLIRSRVRSVRWSVRGSVIAQKIKQNICYFQFGLNRHYLDYLLTNFNPVNVHQSVSETRMLCSILIIIKEQDC